MTTSAIVPVDIDTLRSNLATAIARRQACATILENAQKNATAAGQMLKDARAKLSGFDALDGRVSRYRAEKLKAGADGGGELPPGLHQERQERALARDEVREAEGVLDLITSEVAEAVEQLEAGRKIVHREAVAVLLSEADQKAAEIIKARERLFDLFEDVAGFNSTLLPGGLSAPLPISEAMTHALNTPHSWRTYSFDGDPARTGGAKWIRFYDALCLDAGAQFGD